MGRGQEVSAANEQKVWATLHPLAPMLMSRRDHQPGGSIAASGFTGVGLVSARLTFSFAKTRRTGGTLASLTRGRIWRWLLAACDSERQDV